jgi:ABC-2 type transport system ATP-binding protein
VTLSCLDVDTSDNALREFLTRYPDARDIEVRGVGLEEAFLELTADDEDDVATEQHHGSSGSTEGWA